MPKDTQLVSGKNNIPISRRSRAFFHTQAGNGDVVGRMAPHYPELEGVFISTSFPLPKMSLSGHISNLNC